MKVKSLKPADFKVLEVLEAINLAAEIEKLRAALLLIAKDKSDDARALRRIAQDALKLF
jgi:hypothetical protein